MPASEMSYASAVWLASFWELDDETDSSSGSCLDYFDDDFLFKHFHFTRSAVCFIIDYVGAQLERAKYCSNELSSDVMVLAALCVYANGFLPNEIADMIGISQPSASRAVNMVSRILSDKAEEFITFPNSYNDRVLVAQEIQRFGGIPNGVGVLGCMHVRIIPTPEEETFFLNSFDYHSIMFQIICDSQGNLLSVESQWPGSTSEQSIWESSKISQKFKSGRHGHSWLIGASCYSLERHVLTPLAYVRKRPSMRYNEAHFKIQTVIQKTFGLLKSRFRCLENLGSIQKNNCSTHTEMVNACCVLHNIAMKFSVPLPQHFVPEPRYHGVNREEITQSNSSMLLFREDMIKAFFSQDSDPVPGIFVGFERM
ncbi:hypothetical protein COCON_G00033640 [Conger conger]|uniref:Putative nuclease HARBI1 n=1 Tax=Conger conger TaxID=82655 RepID=A0A9Q1DZS7_CONCO|nr:putative nuclease HARBI1 [Conger conger]KAJ8284514.1 hypothetical protein COCON_G00033640 [Conger conger]